MGIEETPEQRRERLKAYQVNYRERNKRNISEKEKEWYANLSAEEKQERSEKAHEYHLKRKYGITKEQYNSLLEKQNGCCAICDKDCLKGIRLAVDHDHHTNEIRGLLCSYCNHKVIGRHRRGGVLPRAVEYLERDYTGWFAPLKKRVRRPRKVTNVK